MLPVVAARLKERIPEEKEWLLSSIHMRLKYLDGWLVILYKGK